MFTTLTTPDRSEFTSTDAFCDAWEAAAVELSRTAVAFDLAGLTATQMKVAEIMTRAALDGADGWEPNEARRLAYRALDFARSPIGEPDLDRGSHDPTEFYAWHEIRDVPYAVDRLGWGYRIGDVFFLACI